MALGNNSLSCRATNWSWSRYLVQKKEKMTKGEATPEARKLYNALKRERVPAYLEKWDGYKHIDIAIPEAMINIEIDGCHHNLHSNQALADLKRTYHSFKKGYFTLRIPNSLIREHLNEVVDLVIEILNESNDQLDSEEGDDNWF